MATASRCLWPAGVTAAFAALPAQAQTADNALDTVVITATRSERLLLDVPAAVGVVTRDEIRDSQLRINLSESLPRIPGVVALNRENYAQDLQISIRGFGARSTFGVRGLRLYVDGVPASQPDGQGQVSNFPLDSAQRIEVLRGPFSALYGNASGGVIALTTRLEGGPLAAAAGAAAGSFGTWRAVASVGGGSDDAAFAVDGTAFGTDGYREHSAATRQLLDAAVRVDGGASGQWRLGLNMLSMPDAQDPLGLTRTQWQDDPTQASPLALAFDTRKSTRQVQAGLQWSRRLGADWDAAAVAWAGRRSVQQFQAIPVASQAPPSSPGGVIDFERDFGGIDARVQGPWQGWMLTFGLNFELLDEDRRGYENFALHDGQTLLGVQGQLRRDERNRVASVDPYVQGERSFGEHWRLLAGLRGSALRFESSDRYLANGDDSGSVSYRAVTPTLGIVYRLSASSSIYASYGRGFETPTLNEIAYRADGRAGLNRDIEPARSNSVELGLKTALGAAATATLALFSTTTRDDLVVLANSGGRAAFGNAGATSRRGAEVAVDWRLGPQWSVYASASALLAQFDDGFLTCAAAPCIRPDVPVAAGNRLPAVPAYSGYTELRWQPGWADWSLQWRLQSKLYVDDRNQQAAPGYGVVNFAVAGDVAVGASPARLFLRVNNLLDKNYVGALIVNEVNGRYYEPAPGRNWLAGIDVRI